MSEKMPQVNWSFVGSGLCSRHWIFHFYVMFHSILQATNKSEKQNVTVRKAQTIVVYSSDNRAAIQAPPDNSSWSSSRAGYYPNHDTSHPYGVSEPH